MCVYVCVNVYVCLRVSKGQEAKEHAVEDLSDFKQLSRVGPDSVVCFLPTLVV